LHSEILELAKLRNRIVLHGRPGSMPPNDAQRLFDGGVAFDIAQIDDAAAKFTACAVKITDMLHNDL